MTILSLEVLKTSRDVLGSAASASRISCVGTADKLPEIVEHQAPAIPTRRTSLDKFQLPPIVAKIFFFFLV